MTIRRREIWWVSLDPTVGREIKKKRPCIVLSADDINRIRSTPVVVPLSSSPETAPPIIISFPSAGPKSVAVLDQIRAVDRLRFVRKSGVIAQDELAEVLKKVLQLP